MHPETVYLITIKNLWITHFHLWKRSTDNENCGVTNQLLPRGKNLFTQFFSKIATERTTNNITFSQRES